MTSTEIPTLDITGFIQWESGGKQTTTTVVLAKRFNKTHRSLMNTVRRTLREREHRVDHHYRLIKTKGRRGGAFDCYEISVEGFMLMYPYLRRNVFTEELLIEVIEKMCDAADFLGVKLPMP